MRVHDTEAGNSFGHRRRRQTSPKEEVEDEYRLPPTPVGEVVVTCGGRDTETTSMTVLLNDLLPVFKRTDDAEDELTIATIAWEAGAPGVAERLQAVLDFFLNSSCTG